MVKCVMWKEGMRATKVKADVESRDIREIVRSSPVVVLVLRSPYPTAPTSRCQGTMRTLTCTTFLHSSANCKLETASCKLHGNCTVLRAHFHIYHTLVPLQTDTRESFAQTKSQ